MTPYQWRWIFAMTYVVVDLVYVLASRRFYEVRIRAIQMGQKGFAQKPDVLGVALLTYAFMALGWWWLVASQIQATTTIWKTIGVAMVFALIVHGVFNGTVYAMFDGWDWPAMIRDISWGLVWIPTVTLLYRYALQQKA